MKRRGVMFVTVLMLTSLLLILGMGFLGTQGPEGQRAVDAVASAQAYELARAGIEDAKVKFLNDLEFPPHSLDQPLFSYSEERPGLGSYRVTIDSARASLGLFNVVGEGWVGPAAQPQAQSRISVWVQGDKFEVIRWDD